MAIYDVNVDRSTCDHYACACPRWPEHPIGSLSIFLYLFGALSDRAEAGRLVGHLVKLLAMSSVQLHMGSILFLNPTNAERRIFPVT